MNNGAFLHSDILLLFSSRAEEINMADSSSSSKPFVVTSTMSLKVTAPSFYNQPKKFASVAPPRPKGQGSQSHSSTVVSTGVIGRVGEMPPPPPSFCEGKSS